MPEHHINLTWDNPLKVPHNVHTAPIPDMSCPYDRLWIDVALENPSDERIDQAVDLANQIIWESRPVSIRQVTSEEAAKNCLFRATQKMRTALGEFV